jgi:hypothetical protein
MVKKFPQIQINNNPRGKKIAPWDRKMLKHGLKPAKSMLVSKITPGLLTRIMGFEYFKLSYCS